MAPSYYWIKVYHEVLHDPKMGRLSDHLWRRFFELCLIAGEADQEGYLPPVADIAWALRTNPGDLEADLHLLNENGLVTLDTDGSWFVTKFSERQAAVSPTDRWRQWRDRQRSAEYYQTGQHENTNAAQTNRLTDTDTDTETDKIQTREDTETDKDAVAAVALESVAVAAVALESVGMSQIDAVLRETRLTAAQIIETVAYAKQQGLGAAWVRKQLRDNQAHRPRAPNDDRRKYIEGEWADIVEH